MSKRATSTNFITLTYYPNRLKGIQREEYPRVVRKDIHRLKNALRDRAKRYNWGYKILICPSMWKPFTDKSKPDKLHIHLILTSNPSSTCVSYLKGNWQKQGNGHIVDVQKLLTVEDVERVTAYINSQNIFKSPHCQKLNEHLIEQALISEKALSA